MAINYTQAFNAGELSRNIDGRSDFEVYKIGCRDLDNFFVLPQGGVERRAGSEFVQLAGSDGSNPARMIEFDFSSDIRYVIEIGTNYAKVHYEDASRNNYVVDVTGTVNYTLAELEQIQFNRRYDTLILTCPSKAPQIFRRTTLTPTFTIEEIEYVYPPLQEINDTTTNIDASTLSVAISSASLTSDVVTINTSSDHNSKTGDYVVIANLTGGTSPNGSHQITKVDADTFTFPLTGVDVTYGVGSSPTVTNVYTGTTTLTASTAIFHKGHEDSVWAIEHIRDADKKIVADTETAQNTTDQSDALDVSFSNWSFETDGTWVASVIIERSIAGGAFEPYIVIGDTRGGNARNFKYASTVPEDKNTELRVSYITGSGSNMTSFEFSLEADNIYHKGLVKITSVSTTVGTAVTTATATVVSMLQGGKADPDATVFWNEPSFSDYRGFPPASEFFENRLWFGGSKDQPADLFASAFGDIYNFLSGSLSTDAIKRTIDSPEEPKWLEGKRYLFLGTAGSAVSIRSADKDALITQDNITTLVENSYGSAALQAEIANDVVVYVQRDGLKLRELVYDQNSDTFIGNDLNIISEDVTESGVKEMFIQKQPNQIIWCIKENGDACAMTYERGQQIRGWARIETDGEFYSAASIHNGGEDTVWACVKRTTGEDTPVTKYCIEKFHPRKDLNWYVDSGKKFQGTGSKSGIAIQNSTDDFIKINITNHGYSTGDFVNIESSSIDNIASNNYEVERIDDDNFFLRIIGTTEKIAIQGFILSGSSNSDDNGTYQLTQGSGYWDDFRTKWVKENDSGRTFTYGLYIAAAETFFFARDNSLAGTVARGTVGQGDVPTAVAYNSANSGTLTFTFADNKAPDKLQNDDLVTIVGVTKNSVAFPLVDKQIKNIDTSANTFEIQGIGGTGTFALSGASIQSSSRSNNFPWEPNWGGDFGSATFGAIANSNITVKQINNKVTGLSHLEGKTVQVLVDDNYVTDKVVASGIVTVDEYGAKVTAGLPYVSTLRPMPIEPSLVNKLSQSRVKAISKIIVRFFKTKGAAVGEQGKQLTTYSVLDTQDSLGQALEVKTGQQRFFVASDYEREKVIEVRQDLPYPMTVLSIATHINAEGA